MNPEVTGGRAPDGDAVADEFNLVQTYHYAERGQGNPQQGTADGRPLQPDSVATQNEQLRRLENAQEPLGKISGEWLRRLRRGGGRRAAQQATKERSERDRNR